MGTGCSYKLVIADKARFEGIFPSCSQSFDPKLLRLFSSPSSSNLPAKISCPLVVRNLLVL
eukprot:642625-Hanusia_phi.AAC.1